MRREDFLTPFKNEPHCDFTKQENRQRMAQAIEKIRRELGKEYPLLISGGKIMTETKIVRPNPAQPKELIGRVSVATSREADLALQEAEKFFPMWRKTAVEHRASILFKAAEIMRSRKFELAALQILEVGKNWREADADVAEAIDFLDYYAKEMLRLSQPKKMGHVPGEENLYFYQPKGIGVVIAPWNFPLAISTGMVAAGLVTGNTVIYKPAGQSSVIGAKMVEIFLEAGLPPQALHYLPGYGREVGDYLVQSQKISFIVFTGSKSVGLQIVEKAGRTLAGQTSVKRVVAEMGGKNGLIIDSDADLDEAVAAVVQSAFSYQGQKCSACSRAIVLEANYERFLHRLVESVKSLKIGLPEDPATQVGPLIDEEAQKKVKNYVAIGKKEGRRLLERECPRDGYFVGPTIFNDVSPQARIAQEEIFGPVLAVMKAGNFDEALAIANGTEYALTGGLFSRSPSHIEQAKEEFRVGNLYINRAITGALVERQPFGGFKMSGVGSKAGGPDYLLQFMEPRTITENTMRRGFAPEK